MSGPPQDETELYPLRWKLADAAEDLFVLHRGKAIAACIALLLLIVLVGYSLFSNGSDDSGPTLATATSSSTTSPGGQEATSPTTSTLDQDGTSSSTEQLEVVPFDRAVPDSALETSAHGPLILVNSDSAILSGGFSTDGEADAMAGLAEIIFPEWNIEDRQQVNAGFEDFGPIIARIQGRRLFTPGSIDVNPEFHSAIDQIAVFLVSNPGSQVTVVGYSAVDDGDEAELTADRTARVAQRLRTTGVPSEAINIIGPGEEPPPLPKGFDETAGAIDFYLN